jgi:pimeloyl-ACP methyl ester carboxylesterase
MPFLSHGSHRIRYELDGPESGPAYVLVNGLTQYAELWRGYRDALIAKDFRVLTFDLLGQGESDKPSLFIDQNDQVSTLRALVDLLGKRPVFLAGISFGGLIALRYAIAHGDTLAGLVQMSSFAELSPQLLLLGNALRTGLILGGTSYLQDLLLPMNLSDAWLGPQLKNLDAIKRQGWLGQRRLRTAKPDGIIPRIRGANGSPQFDSLADLDSQRRIRFPHPSLAARYAANADSGQRSHHHSPRLSRVYAGEASLDCRPARKVRKRRPVEAMEWRGFDLDCTR